MGSPDRTGMQLDGLGGGISSTSKVCIVSESKETQFDVNYLFGQVSIKERKIDWKGSCANLSSAVGLFALRNGFTKSTKVASPASKGYQSVSVWQENLGQHMVIEVANPSLVKERVSIPGVPGLAPPIKVRWVSPSFPGVNMLLPTGNVVDSIVLKDNAKQIAATLICGTNPTVFVRAEDLNLSGHELPGEINYNKTLESDIEHIRNVAAKLMGIDMPNDGLRVCWVASPKSYAATNGEIIDASKINILARITTPGRVHHAMTGTGAGNLAIAANILGTIPASKCVASSVSAEETVNSTSLNIGQPAGIMQAAATVGQKDAEDFEGIEGTELEGSFPFVKSVELIRTARFLMHGYTELGDESYQTCVD